MSNDREHVIINTLCSLQHEKLELKEEIRTLLRVIEEMKHELADLKREAE